MGLPLLLPLSFRPSFNKHAEKSLDSEKLGEITRTHAKFQLKMWVNKVIG